MNGRRHTRGGPGNGEGNERSPWAYAGLGLEIAVPVLAGLYVGHRLDLWLGTEPWFLLVGAIGGMTLGLYGFIKSVLGGRSSPGDGER